MMEIWITKKVLPAHSLEKGINAMALLGKERNAGVQLQRGHKATELGRIIK